MRSVLLATMIGLLGCVGELDTTGGGGGGNGGNGGGGTDLARSMYESDVYPVMKAKCIACHNISGPSGNLSGFVTPDLNQAYTTMVGYQALVGSFTPALAGVVIKIEETNHYNINYTSAELADITGWLNQEVLERNGGGGGGTGGGTTTETPAQASQRVLAEWSACMTETNFTTANMAPAWDNLTANNNQRCSNCHASGDGGFWASPITTEFFEIISTNKYFMLQYFTVKLDLANLANSNVEINTASFEGVSKGQDPHREHPRFNATTNNGMTALRSFYDLTMEAKTAAGAAGCGPSKLQ